MLPLDRELVFLDIESTGLDILKDRIVQIALIKFNTKNAKQEEVNVLVNPMMPIPAKVTEIHGITDEMVKDAKPFSEIAPWLYMFIGNADLAGYNSNRFDIPLLQEEFHRAGLDFSLKDRRTVDVQTIFHKMEPRNLRAAYRFYTGKVMENAHDALADVRATIAVFEGQLEKYQGKEVEDEDGRMVISPIKGNIASLSEFSVEPGRVDSMNRFKRDKNGTIYLNFGKFSGQPALQHEPFLKWMLEAEFSAEVKGIARELLREIALGRK